MVAIYIFGSHGFANPMCIQVHVLVHVGLRLFSYIMQPGAFISQLISDVDKEDISVMQNRAKWIKSDSKSADLRVMGVRPPPGTNKTKELCS